MSRDTFGFPQHERLNEVDAASRASSVQFDASLLGFLSKGHDSNGNVAGMSRISDFREWKDVPYDATMFKVNPPAVWTVPPAAVLNCAYRIIGKSMRFHITLSGSNTIVGGNAPYFRVRIPDSYICAESTASLGWYQDNAGIQIILCTANKGTNSFVIYQYGLGNFVPTAFSNLYLQIEIRVK